MTLAEVSFIIGGLIGLLWATIGLSRINVPVAWHQGVTVLTVMPLGCGWLTAFLLKFLVWPFI